MNISKIKFNRFQDCLTVISTSDLFNSCVASLTRAERIVLSAGCTPYVSAKNSKMYK